MADGKAVAAQRQAWAGLRRRGRPDAQPTEGTHLGTTWTHAGGPGVGQGIRTRLNTHVSAATRQMIDARGGLHVIRLPAYAPDLNPTEAVWSHRKRSIGNLP
ncbi:transposase [Micromonospora sp. NPDC050980]|uniref:transposase n=1 Tax=Micromonospora sp. NPDC050980 TaxID=3155161 RepID=UPI0033D05ACF